MLSMLLIGSPFWVRSQGNSISITGSSNTNQKKMQVEIWSDVVCPFCYIGKRKFEQALNRFPQKDKVEILWKSFQLDPEASNTGSDYQKNLSERKGWSPEQTRQIIDNVSKMAAEVGLTYHLDKAIAANSFDAHRFSHLAQEHGLQDDAEEALFKAHFTDGKNISDRGMLVELGRSIGLDAAAVQTVLDSQEYSKEVKNDMEEARQLRVSGVPFFVFDRKYAVSGAQDSAVFLQTLEKAFETWDGVK
jgi:predicted DsbA family dithiol-disulfide isomerase